MNKFLLLLLSILNYAFQAYSQNAAANNDGSPPAASAMLDVKSLNKGMLIPRVSLTGSNTRDSLRRKLISCQ